MKYTKGPWRISGWDIIGGDDSIVAKIIPWDASGCREEDSGNANLIASLPDIVEAVRGLLGSLDNGEFKTTIPESSIASEMAEKAYRINRAEVDRLIKEVSDGTITMSVLRRKPIRNLYR